MGMKPRRNPNAPKTMPEPPEWFNEGQKKVYREVGARVLKMKVWEETDFDAFCILVDNLYAYQEASKVIAVEGVMTKGRDSKWVRHPATIVRNACWTNIQPLLVAFGLTPSARAHMGLVSDDDADPISEFLSGNNNNKDPGRDSTNHH
jgi:P27 family predicted phage terminase small subunit